ncbi:MAG: DUF502 domain-containing protein [Deltaproteobacteria bacterium]|nr:DUF502 domain-containing protein [Deltaproteobacteria bacterium]
MKRLAKYFFEGILVVVPAMLSLYIVYAIFTKIDGLLRLPIPGIGFIITIVAITLIGILASTFLTRRIFGLIEKILTKLPLVKLLYTSIKDLMSAFVGDKKSFDKPVLITMDTSSELQALGFITKDSLEFLGLKDHVSVYLPQSYNFAGNLLICPAKNVTPISTDSSEVMAFLVSGGVSGGSEDEDKK